MTLVCLVYWLRQKRYLSVSALADHFSIMSTLNSFNLVFIYISHRQIGFSVCLCSLATQDSFQLAHGLFWSSKGTAGIHKQPFFLSLPSPVLSVRKVGSAHTPYVHFATLSSPSLSRPAGLWRGSFGFAFFVVHHVAVADEKINCRWRYKSPWALLSETFCYGPFFFLSLELYTNPRNDCTVWIQSGFY